MNDQKSIGYSDEKKHVIKERDTYHTLCRVLHLEISFLQLKKKDQVE